MLALGITTAVVALLVIGICTGWALRGPTAKWCPQCGGSLSCRACDPAIGRARVRR
jgi:hypothetical protein